MGSSAINEYWVSNPRVPTMISLLFPLFLAENNTETLIENRVANSNKKPKYFQE